MSEKIYYPVRYHISKHKSTLHAQCNYLSDLKGKKKKKRRRRRKWTNPVRKQGGFRRVSQERYMVYKCMATLYMVRVMDTL